MPDPGYNPDEPAIAQDDDWSCAITSARWGMFAYGRSPTEQWIESTALAEGVESTDLGLMDATGAGLAAFITEQYGEFGYSAYNVAVVTFNDVVQVAGLSPVLIGGRDWAHWTGVRRFNQSTGLLELANPADHYMNIGQTLDRQQFADLGAFSMVVIAWGTAPVPVPVPSPVTVQSGPFAGLTLEQLDAKAQGLLNATAYLGDTFSDSLTALAKEAQRVRVEQVGPRP